MCCQLTSFALLQQQNFHNFFQLPASTPLRCGTSDLELWFSPCLPLPQSPGIMQHGQECAFHASGAQHLDTLCAQSHDHYSANRSVVDCLGVPAIGVVWELSNHCTNSTHNWLRRVALMAHFPPGVVTAGNRGGTRDSGGILLVGRCQVEARSNHFHHLAWLSL